MKAGDPEARLRCEWAREGDPLHLAYHDEEWGLPSQDDRHLFELSVLEGAAVGLSWATILAKRQGYMLRGADDLLRGHAGSGHGQRPLEYCFRRLEISGT